MAATPTLYSFHPPGAPEGHQSQEHLQGFLAAVLLLVPLLPFVQELCQYRRHRWGAEWSPLGWSEGKNPPRMSSGRHRGRSDVQ